MAYAGQRTKQQTILNPNNINENFKIIVVDFIANLKSAIYSKQGYFQYKLLPYLEYPPRSLSSNAIL
jgi:hypothetical protein